MKVFAAHPVKRGIILLSGAVAIAALLTGCSSSGGDLSSPSRKAATVDVARIVCDRSGTRVLPPGGVEARPDGVHFSIDNRSGASVDYAAELPEGGSKNGDAPLGASEHVESLPPGEVRVGCYDPSETHGETERDRYETLVISDVDGDYKPVELECSGGRAASGMGSYGGAAGGLKGAPADLARRKLSEDLEAGDIAEIAGYPGSRGEKTVRVVRDGKVLATIAYHRQPEGGWLEGAAHRCSGF